MGHSPAHICSLRIWLHAHKGSCLGNARNHKSWVSSRRRKLNLSELRLFWLNLKGIFKVSTLTGWSPLRDATDQISRSHTLSSPKSKMPHSQQLEMNGARLLFACLALVLCGTCRENPKCVGPELSEEYQRDGFVLLRQFLNASQVRAE